MRIPRRTFSRLSRVPHASMCGGRARCSTCRVQVLNGLEFLERPGPDEQLALERAGIDAPDIRLACQVRPRADLSVVTLVPAAASAARFSSLDRYQTGVERNVTIMFVDIRGFTRFSDGRLPYDIVFILNQYLGRMSDAIIAEGEIQPARSRELGFEIPGTVTEVLVKEGDRVAAGTLLARLDTREMELALRSAEQDVAAQQAGAVVVPPRLTIDDGEGGWKWARVCREGPVFDAREILWEEETESG